MSLWIASAMIVMLLALASWLGGERLAMKRRAEMYERLYNQYFDFYVSETNANLVLLAKLLKYEPLPPRSAAPAGEGKET